MDKRELTLAVVRPTEVGHESGEAMDRLMGVCWHTYTDASGTRYQGRYEPNLNKIIEVRANAIPNEDAKQGVLTHAQNYFGGHLFRLVAWPSSPRAVSDDAELWLVLSESEALDQRECEYADDTDPQATFPRRFRNAILGIAPAPRLLEEAIATVRRLQAAGQVRVERQRKRQETGDRRKAALEEQAEEPLPLLQLRAQRQTCRAFNRVSFQGRRSVALSAKYLVPADGALSDVHGTCEVGRRTRGVHRNLGWASGSGEQDGACGAGSPTGCGAAAGGHGGGGQTGGGESSGASDRGRPPAAHGRVWSDSTMHELR